MKDGRSNGSVQLADGSHALLDTWLFKDTLRRYCESLWYSGLEFKRPTDEEILAKCGILFHKQAIPSTIMYAFFYQLDNMFAMSKVVHTIRSMMDWLDATENRAFQVLSVYEMHSQMPNFVETLADHWKALQICHELLPRLGSIYHRIHAVDSEQKLTAKAIIDFQAYPRSQSIRTNQFYHVTDTSNPHLWQLSTNPNFLIPSLFLEVSTELAEAEMLGRLKKRFDQFLIMCHGRTRRHLQARLSEQLKLNPKCATLPIPEISSMMYQTLTATDGHYFPKSPHSTKRWRTFSNAQVLHRQPTLKSATMPEDLSSPTVVRKMLARLRRWLHHLPSPGSLLADQSPLRPRRSRRNVSLSDGLFDGDEVVVEVHMWWSLASLSIPDPTELDRIVNEAYFLKKHHRPTENKPSFKSLGTLAAYYKSLNDIMQMMVDIGVERSNMTKSPKLHSLRRYQREYAGGLSWPLLEELSSRLGQPFYHPRSGRTSYRWIQKSLDRSNSPSPPPISGIEICTEVQAPIRA